MRGEKMKIWYMYLLGLLICLAQNSFPYNYISWLAQKGEQTYWNYLGIDLDNLSGVVSCHAKGPNMANYIMMDWDEGRTQWYNRLFYSTLNDLQKNSVGTWFLKIVYYDGFESIYTFTISGTLEESDFPPVPAIIEPADGASNIIAEDYELVWDSNGADAEATMLGAEIGGNGFFYSSNNLNVSSTTWNPGWLEIGDAYFKITYSINRTAEMLTYPSYVSGPEVFWHFVRAYTGSGIQNDFYVKYSLDLSEDNVIDLLDLDVLCSHWLEPAPSEVDFDDNGIVNLADFTIFSENWLLGV